MGSHRWTQMNTDFNLNSEGQPRKGAKNAEEPRQGRLELGQFLPAPFSCQKLGFALFVTFRGHSISELGFSNNGPSPSVFHLCPSVAN